MATVETASGHHVYYDVTGDGPPLLMFCGRIVSRKGWELQIPALAPHFRLIMPDNRDAGESDPETEPYTVEDMAADGIAVLDALGVSRAHVLGHSMGTAIALALVLEYPERVDRLILASGRIFDRRPGDDGPPAFRREDWIDDPVARRRVRAVTSVAPGYFDAHPEQYARVVEQERGNRLTYEGVLRQMQSVSGFTPHARLSEITAPTLVIHGDQDNLIPVEGGRDLAQRIPGAQWRMYEGVGHSPHIERTVDFNHDILTFLQETPGS